jgi:hypothetical protein
MDPQTLTLARLLVTAALVAATCKYAELIRRRALRTAHARERAMFEEQGLDGLVRVFLAGGASREPSPRRPAREVAIQLGPVPTQRD